jgi:hypothetical protein
MLRIITNSKEDGRIATTTIPSHMEHYYDWAGYLKCPWCYVLVSPLAMLNLLRAFTSRTPNRIMNTCPNCGSLWLPIKQMSERSRRLNNAPIQSYGVE